MLQVKQVSKSFGAQVILDNVSFVVNPGDRVGLVGPNGSGKTILLRVIVGLEHPDSGHVTMDHSATLGYLPQGLEPAAGRAVGEEVRSGIPGYETARRAAEELAVRMTESQGEELEQLVQAYGEALNRFETLGGYAVDNRAMEVLSGLGLEDVPPEKPVEQLSGGQQTRLGLARLLLAEPNLLLLDEPTNHLDIVALEWLEEFLSTYRGAVVIVSHDRTFLDHTVRRIVELDETTHRLSEYAGSYSDYEMAKAAALDKQWAAWQDQQAEIRRVEADIRRTKGQALQGERATIAANFRRYAKKVAKKAKAREHRLQRYLDSQERVDKPRAHWRLNLHFDQMTRGGQIVLSLAGLGQHFDERWLFRGVGLTVEHGERIILLGPNGSGKSTLLRIITGEIAPSEGLVRIGASVRLGYMPQEQESLEPTLTPLALIRQTAPISETDARSFLHFFLFSGDEVFVPVEKLSYGERARLLLARLVLDGSNCLLLDEPINHLDIPSRERFEAALEAFPGTVLAAVHDRAFIDRFATGIWSLEEGTIRRYVDRESVSRAGRRGRRR